MGDAYRDQYEAALQQNEALRRENAALRAYVERLQAAPGERPSANPHASDERHSPLLFGTMLLSVFVLAGSALFAGAHGPRRFGAMQSRCPYARGAAPAPLAEARPCPFLARQRAAAEAEAEGERKAAPSRAGLGDERCDVQNSASLGDGLAECAQRRALASPGAGGLGQLGAATGGLRVEFEGSVPAGARVRIDDVEVPLRGRFAERGGLSQGAHTVRVSAPGREALEQEALVGAGVSHTVTVALGTPAYE